MLLNKFCLNPKPNVDQQTKVETAKKKRIYPEKKPSVKKEIAEIEKIEDVAELETEAKEQVFIYPEKKPIIFKKNN